MKGPPSCRIRVRVKPRASPEGVAGIRAGLLQVRVGAPPVKGRANARCGELLAAWLGIPRSRVRLLKGERSREKTFLLDGLEGKVLTERIEALKAEGR